MDQRDLIERAQRGDHDAFAALIDPTIARLDATARMILRDRELARDAVQDSLLQAWRDVRGVRDPDRFHGWLYRLTVRTCLRAARRRNRRSIEVALDAIEIAGASDPSVEVVRRELLDHALRRLDPAHRAVVALHYLLDLPLREVAETLGIPHGTAKSRLHYALEAMRFGVAEPGATTRPIQREQVA